MRKPPYRTEAAERTVALSMTTTRIVLSIATGIAQAVIVALACHGAGLNAHGFVLLPLAAGAGTAWFVARKG